ncbi:MAG: hypothetical protein JWP00_3792 [Chloroflexi bacterium]|nr:hypothetical protein [Chloroflexota bacterium]
MFNENPKEVLRKHYTGVWNAGEPSRVVRVLEETVAPNYMDHNPLAGLSHGYEGLNQMVGMFQTAFPDLKLEVELLLEDGDKAIGRWTMRGTQTGHFALGNLPPSGKPLEITGIDIVRVESGKIVEWWHQEDVMAMLAQLGVLPVSRGVPA